MYPLLRNNGGINDRLELDVSQVVVVQNNLSRSEQEENFILKKLKLFDKHLLVAIHQPYQLRKQ